MSKMFVLGQNPTLIILVSALILLQIDRVDAQGDPIAESHQFPCFSSEDYTSNSPFETNLNILLSSLVSNGSQHGFFNTSIGVSPDIVYGLVQCRGDISPDSCRTCLQNSSVELIKRCPKRRVATLRYDQCILRYSNVQFFSQVDTTELIRSEYRSAQVSDADAGRFNELLRSLLTSVSEVAASRPNGFGSKISEDTSTGKRVIGLVQCNEDLSPTNCTSCVQNLISEIPFCCDKRLGAKIFSSTCYLRYEQGNSGSVNGNVTRSGNGKSSTNAAVIIVPTIASALLLLVICGYFTWRRTRINRRKPTPKINDGRDDKLPISTESLQYDFNTIRRATNNFSDENKLGEGGFGTVYKGWLDGLEIAVKRLHENSEHGSQQFENEVISLHKLQHKNIVRLLGFCLDGEEKLLILEYVRNGSLDKYIFDSNKTSYLDWASRYKVIRGIARGLHYMHEGSRGIIHRDLKAGNVLLDEEMNPKVADFGLAKLLGADQTRGNTSKVAGTLGYMPPEYLEQGLYSTKSDVYSFGVLLLEIVSGQSVNKFKNSGPSWTLLHYAWQVWTKRNPLGLIDPVLDGDFTKEEATRCIHIALLCVQRDMETRPSMLSVFGMLNSNTDLPAFTQETKTGARDPTGSSLSNDNDLTLPR